jgi:aspartate/methionine/tyrosine aminotransferase
MIILNSPTNPTGAVLDKGTIEGIADVARRRRILVISDEVYEKILYNDARHHSIGSLEGMEDLTITVNAFSKTYAMTGWRLGYAAGNPRLIRHMLKFHQASVTCASVMVQKAGVAALKSSQDSVASMVDEYRKRRELILTELSKISQMTAVSPKGTFYVFPNISEFRVPSEKFADILLNEAGVATTPGEAFGSKRHIRMSFANSIENIAEAMERIKEVIKRLRGLT